MHRIPAEISSFPYQPTVTDSPGGGGGLPYETDGDARRKFLI